MELRDFIVTPLIIILVYVIAYIVRLRVTDPINRKYFFPALTFKIIGAIALGFLYQFYYDGGDTFMYHTHGSRLIWEATMESPATGLKLMLSSEDLTGGTFRYASRITFYSEPSSFFIVRLASIFDLFTFSSYSATAVLFAVLSFSGMWMFFVTFYKQAPHLHRWIALAVLFIPSVIFWGSGIMKDTVTLACLGFLTSSIYSIFIARKYTIQSILLLLVSIWVIFVVKKYILLCFLPAALLWVYASRLHRIRSVVLKILIVPIVLTLLILSGYYSVVLIGEDDPKYSLDKIAETAQITAYDIGFYTGRDAGSGYDLGELDGTFQGMIALFPEAVNVSLFRPYLWEVKNPLMLLSAVESLGLLVLTIYLFFRFRIQILRAFLSPPVLFCLLFSLTFAFAVGVSTFNFGTLARYKIPLLPFYVIAITFILDYVNKDKKLDVLDETE